MEKGQHCGRGGRGAPTRSPVAHQWKSHREVGNLIGVLLYMLYMISEVHIVSQTARGTSDAIVDEAQAKTPFLICS